MRKLMALWARVRGQFAGSSADAEMREEFESHLAMHIDENIRRGMSPDRARREALIAAGGMTLAAEAVRERRGLPWLESLATDLRYAARTLRLNKGYSIAVILTVALGIGANAAMFTIINAVVLRPLPFPEPDRLVAISVKNKTEDMGVVPDRTYAEWARSSKSVVISTSGPESGLFTLGDETESVDGKNASASYFRVLGVRPRMGRVFTAEEDVPNGPRVIVLSEQLWRRRFASDSAVIGKVVTVDGKPTTIVGVMPASYTTEHGAQFWVPLRIGAPSPGSTHYFMVTARLRDGVSIDAARAELAVLETSLEEHQPPTIERAKPDVFVPVVRNLHDSLYGETKRPLLLLFGAVGVLLLIACANLTNLSLARAARREREFVVRLALGGSRWRLARHVLSESLLLSLVGAAVGLALSTIAVRYLVRLSPRSVGRVEGIHVDGQVLLFTLLAAVLTALLFGLVPARIAGKGNLTHALSTGGPRSSGAPRQRWIRRVLVVAQLATALMLITGAGVVARTFWRVTSLDVGFRADHLLLTRLTLPGARYNAQTAPAFYDDLIARIRHEPAVERAAFTDVAPLGGVAMSVSSTDSTGKSTPRVDVVDVAPGYLETIGARLVQGRFIDATDRPGAPAAAVITQTTARVLFPDGSALGRRLPFHDLNVVGVIQDIRQRELEAVPGPSMYLAIAQQGGMKNRMTLALRTNGNPELLEAVVRRAVRAIDPALPAPTFMTMEQKLSDTVAPRRFAFVLLALFAVLAGSLAVIGLYGVLAYLVADRTREIGIRIALGADISRVRRLVIVQGMALAGFGIVIGIGGSALAAQTLKTMVYEVSVYDPRAFVAGTLVLSAVAYLACYIPARRASRVDPIMALRAE